MPASTYQPIASVLRNSFHGAKGSGLDSKMDSSLQKSLLVPVQYDDPVRQTANLSDKQKSKYIILTQVAPQNNGQNNSDGVPGVKVGKLDQVPDPRVTLFRRDQVEIGYRSQAGPGSGMFNMGNTCYLNSTLQALFHTPALVNYLKFGGHENSCGSNGFSSCTICILAATLRGTTSGAPMKPIKIYEKLKVICKHLVHGRQEDAHEFLRYLIESLQRSYLISKKIPKNIDNYTKETTPFNQIFGGYMRQDVTCLRCKHVSTTFQHFMDLLLDIRQADNIDTALAGYFRRENLGQGENMYKCEKCHQKVPATKQYKIERPPIVLCIQLKRFNMMGGKNGRPVSLARKLNISNHVRWALTKSIPVEYKLVSMINHVGPSPNCGHYTSIAEAANGTFYRFDDASVSPTSVQSALNTSAYVIFYEMLKSTRNQIVSASPGKEEIKSKASPASTPIIQRKVIGPQLPSPSPAKVPTISPSPKPIPSPGTVKTPALVKSSPLVKPKLISESKPVNNKEPVKVGLVPYDGGDSDSDDSNDAPPPLVKQNVISKVPPSSASSVCVTSPFLPRAVNLKKLKDTVLKEDAPHIISKSESQSLSSKKSEPNRDPSSEILFSKVHSLSTPPEVQAIQSNRNDFNVREADSDRPHSDNSSGSTTSFTISDQIKPVAKPASDGFLATSRQKWSVVSKNEETATTHDMTDDSEGQGSPKKRKKNSLFENGGQILGKAAEIGKEFLTAGAKLFKSNKVKDIEDSISLESGTSCEATTSYSHDKASSSKISTCQVETDTEERRKKQKKKKKKKHEGDKESDDSETWIEKTKDNLEKFNEESINSIVKKSESNPDAPVKSWDSKPDMKNIGRSVTWDGSKGSNIAEVLRKQSEIRSWSGDRSKDLERKSTEPRKRSAAQELDAELDAGRSKKAKKWKDDSSRWGDRNPFHLAQEHRNKGEKLDDKPEFQRRHSDSFSHARRNSDHGSNPYHRHSHGDRNGKHWSKNGHRDQKHHRDNSYNRFKSSFHHYRK